MVRKPSASKKIRLLFALLFVLLVGGPAAFLYDHLVLFDTRKNTVLEFERKKT